MKGFTLLVLRLGSVSLIYFLAISLLVKISGKDIVGDFINAQNNLILVSGIGSLGFHSILMYYGARSNSLLLWATRQMLLCAPISIAVCFICAMIVEALHPSAGVTWITLGGSVTAISSSLPGGLLGAGRYGPFTVIEILSSLMFLVGSAAISVFFKITTDVILLCYTLSTAFKILLYLYAQKQLFATHRRAGRSWRKPSIPLFRRFLGPAWVAGNLYATAYRAMLAIFQVNSSVSPSDIALVWSVTDKVQNIFQTINLIIFRISTKSRAEFRRIRTLVDYFYIPATGIAYAGIGVLIKVWAESRGAPIGAEAFYVILPLIIWGYRSFQQNLLSSQRMLWPISFNLCLVLFGWAMLAGATFIWLTEWWLRIVFMCSIVAVSAVNLRAIDPEEK